MSTLRHIAVIVPARNEEERISACLDSIDTAMRRMHRDHPGVTGEVTVVLDCCTDRTGDLAAERHAQTIISRAGRVGSARRAGIDAALRRARRVGVAPCALWLANTDADSTVPDTWLADQLRFADTGFDMVVGTVTPEGLEPETDRRWRARHHLANGHSHVHGANLGLRASTYLAVGGFADVSVHEDLDIVTRVQATSSRWTATHQVNVTTSGRHESRVDGGFASYIADLGAGGLVVRLVVLGPSHHPVAAPFAGGLERFTADLVRGLRRRGHYVELHGLDGSDASLADRFHQMPALPPLSAIASADPNMPEPQFLHDQFVYAAALRDLLCRDDVDAVLNESLHQLPLALSPSLKMPMLTTLHTPPFPWMELGVWLAGDSGHFVAVSQALRDQWCCRATSDVILNGVDPEGLPLAGGGSDLAWVGRMTPEKGADLAIEAARLSGRRLRLAGPITDAAWFETVVRPMLDGQAQYVGPLHGPALAELYGGSAATLVTPRWEEPFCLVAAESQMCGTPVAGIRRGGLPEVVTKPGGRLVTPGPGVARRLADAVEEVATADRQQVGAHARTALHWDLMIDHYERLLVELRAGAQDRPRRTAFQRGAPFAPRGRAHVIGYYVHHHGRGHVSRALAIADELDEDIVFLSSLPAPAGLRRRDTWARLPLDIDPAAPERDVTAGGRLHWAPLGVSGLATRAKMTLDLVAGLRLRRFVVDCSAEITMLVRLAGVPVTVVTQPGDRDDDAHRLAFDVADQIIAPWSACLYHPKWLARHDNRTHYVGAISRFDGRSHAPRGGGSGVLLAGAGGSGMPADAIAPLRRAQPRLRWRGVGGGSGWVVDVWPLVSAAEIVVTHAGQGALADLAVAGIAAVVVPQDRPFHEQHRAAEALERAGVAVVVNGWPSADEWPALLARARTTDPTRWKLLDAEGAASRAAAVLAI